MRGNPDNLRQAAARKSAAAQTRAESALREMIRRQQPITFRGLAHTAGVSLDFLYRHADLRRRVEHLRAQQSQPTTPTPVAMPDEPSNVVRALTAQISTLKRQHRTEIDALNQALQAADGENPDTSPPARPPNQQPVRRYACGRDRKRSTSTNTTPMIHYPG
jgi:hypothetical protein